MTNQEIPFNPIPKLLVTITDRDECKRLEDILREKHVHFHYMFNGIGTASSEVLKAFGLSGTEKTVCICMEPAVIIKPLMTAVVERLEFTRPGNGIAFTIPISSVSKAMSTVFTSELEQHKERWPEVMDKEIEKAGGETQYEMVVSVINQGFSETLLEAARETGARGGTIIHARRSGVEDAVKFFGVSLQAEKEIVAILVHRSQKKELMQAIVKACGAKTEARGIVVALPVESCAGINISNENDE